MLPALQAFNSGMPVLFPVGFDALPYTSGFLSNINYNIFGTQLPARTIKPASCRFQYSAFGAPPFDRFLRFILLWLRLKYNKLLLDDLFYFTYQP